MKRLLSILTVLAMTCSMSALAEPSSMEELERQVTEKYQDSKASIEMRLNKAKMDMELAPLFRNVVYNDDAEVAFEQIKKVILEELEKRKNA